MKNALAPAAKPCQQNYRTIWYSFMTESTEAPCLSRREARRRDRRGAIIGVARRSFLNNGYAATTMSSIAAELGGSKGTLWSYFPGKEELFAAVLRETTET